jgi:translation initiation factor IF-2
MAVGQRLSKVAIELNVGISTIVEFLHKKGFTIDVNPNTKVSEDMFVILSKEYKLDQTVKKASEELIDRKLKDKKESISIEDMHDGHDVSDDDDAAYDRPVEKTFLEPRKTVDVKVVGKIDLPGSSPKKPEPSKPVVAEQPIPVEQKPVVKEEVKQPIPPKVEEKEPRKEIEHIAVKYKKLEDEIKVVGKIDLDKPRPKPQAEQRPREEQRPAQVVNQPKEVVVPKQVEKAPVADVKPVVAQEPATKSESASQENFVPTKVQKLSGPTVVGKIDLPVEPSRNGDNRGDDKKKKKKRKRIKKDKERVNITPGSGDRPAGQGQQQRPAGQGQQGQGQQGQGQTGAAAGTGTETKPGEKKILVKKKPAKVKKRPVRPEVNEVDVAKQIKDTLARLTSKGKSKASRHRRDKRDMVSQRQQAESDRLEEEKQVLRVTEFVTANEIASLMNVPINQIIASCMSLGLFVSINQRLDAETIVLVAEEFGYTTEFISVEIAESIAEVEDKPEDLIERPPIVTVMGHVDHGKTSLLDYIRSADVTAGEAGGITQHIGAYSLKLDNGRQITFLDTPGHEAFTAMRARGAQVTDIVIIIVAADDNVMPQTIEAINHAAAAGVPIVFAINKVDKPGANPDRVREDLAKMNYLVEDWGGKYQCQEISAKFGTNVKVLLEKVLLEADMLELKANPNKMAVGSVIESTLDRGRGYVATLLVRSGSMKVGDLILAGSYYGHVKAMFNERNQRIDAVGPSEPVLVLGLNGAPQAGEKFNVMENERETKEIATKRLQLQREQGMRAQKHITLDEIGRRIAIGNFQELNLIVKGDVDGSIEALSDSLIKLSTEEIQVNVIHKAVGGISESDIMLAAASNAIVVGFQVRPSLPARRIAEKEQIDIRLYSIIYDAIEEIRAAMEGMLSPEIKEQILSTVEVRETFDITKVGTIAGCMVREGKIKRNSKIRVIRDGIVIHSGELGSLKRFKDDAKEVSSGFECGLNIHNFNDIKIGDMIEAYEEIEVSRKL